MSELIGASPLEVFREVARENRSITKFRFRIFTYTPQKFDETKNTNFWISKRDFLKTNTVDQLIYSLEQCQLLGIDSETQKMHCDNVHIPMMDFNIGKSDKGLEILIERLEKANVSNGWILESGKSYQFIGCNLLSSEEWIDFMGTSLLTSIVHKNDCGHRVEQVADPRYIGHSLRRGCNTLRVSSNTERSFDQKVVAKI